MTNVPDGFHKAVSVAVVHAVAIAEDGTLTTWGSDSFILSTGAILTGLLNAPKGGPFKEVSSIVLYSLALHEDGTLYGWGGIGTFGINILNGWTPTPEDQKIYYIPDQKFNTIAAGNRHALAIQPNGTVMGWGDNSGGALNTPMHVRFQAVDAGLGFSIGLSTNGTLWGWEPQPSHRLRPRDGALPIKAGLAMATQSITTSLTCDSNRFRQRLSTLWLLQNKVLAPLESIWSFIDRQENTKSGQSSS